METGNGNKQFWSRWSGRYDWFMRGNEPLYEEMAARIKTRLDRRMNVLELAGFQAYHKWDVQGFEEFVSRCGFAAAGKRMMGSKIAPLCYLEARPTDG